MDRFDTDRCIAGGLHPDTARRMGLLAGACLIAGLLAGCGLSEDLGDAAAAESAAELDAAAKSPDAAAPAREPAGDGAPTTGSAASAPTPAPSVATPTPASAAATTSAAPTATAANSVDAIVNDMKLRNDLPLAGVSGGQGWATGPGHVIMGADPRGSHTPSWFRVSNSYYKSAAYWNAAIPWVVIFDGVGNGASNTRVQMRNLRMYLKRKSTGAWERISHATAIDGSLFTKALTGLDIGTPNVRREADGTTSVLPPGGNAVFHGWGSLIDLTNPADIAAVYVTMQARLVLNNANGNDDRGAAKYLIHVGGDYYPERSTRVTDMGPSYFFPGIGVSRSKLVTTEWQGFNFATIDSAIQDPGGGVISEAAFRAAPPPLE
ncbi:MAG: hypothetical protein AB7G13_23195 [Lautropia sp.]